MFKLNVFLIAFMFIGFVSGPSAMGGSLLPKITRTLGIMNRGFQSRLVSTPCPTRFENVPRFTSSYLFRPVNPSHSSANSRTVVQNLEHGDLGQASVWQNSEEATTFERPVSGSARVEPAQKISQVANPTQVAAVAGVAGTYDDYSHADFVRLQVGSSNAPRASDDNPPTSDSNDSDIFLK